MRDIKFKTKLDLAYFFGVLLTLSFIANKFITSKEIIKIILYFLLVTIVYFVWASCVIKKLEIKSLKVDKSLDDISLLLYKNSLYMHKKIGDYYEFKTRNFIIPNTSIFIKENNIHCVVLAPLKDSIWIKKDLSKSKIYIHSR